MSKPIEISILLQEDDTHCDWKSVEEIVKGQVDCNFTQVPTTREELSGTLKKTFNESDIILVDVPFRIQMDQHMTHRTVRSHFMNYCDYLEKNDNKWWAHSTFSEVFHPIMLDVMRGQNFKGPAIFLGISPICIPVLDTLTRVGVNEVAFLKVDDEVSSMDKEFHESLGAMFGVQFTEVDSNDFIQSEREYSFCFVAKEKYQTRIIDDMSYFHFLSQRSTVFDLSGKSNFHFDEVKALGVRVILEETLSKPQIKAFLEKILQFDAAK